MERVEEVNTMIKRDNFILIQGWMVTELGLKGNDLLVYAMIYGFTQGGYGRFTGGVKYLMAWTHSSKTTVINTLNKLLGRGLVAKEKNGKNSYFVSVSRDELMVKNAYAESKKCDDMPQNDAYDIGQKPVPMQENQSIIGQKTVPMSEEPETIGQKTVPKQVKKFDLIGQKTGPININNNIYNNINTSSSSIVTASHSCGTGSATNRTDVPEDDSAIDWDVVEQVTDDASMKTTSLENDAVIEDIPFGQQSYETAPKDKVKKTALSNEDISRVMTAWNALSDVGIYPVKGIRSGTRRYSSLRARIQESDVDTVLEAIHNIRNSKFLQGNNKNGWMVTFDWFVRPNNFIKVLEGNYTDSGKDGGSDEGRNDGRNDRGYQQATYGKHSDDKFTNMWYEAMEKHDIVFTGWD